MTDSSPSLSLGHFASLVYFLWYRSVFVHSLPTSYKVVLTLCMPGHVQIFLQMSLYWFSDYMIGTFDRKEVIPSLSPNRDVFANFLMRRKGCNSHFPNILREVIVDVVPSSNFQLPIPSLCVIDKIYKFEIDIILTNSQV